ncbi:hypothetical protein BH24ACT4_BH24ACT4_09840 [soil metagenome]
MDGEAKSVGTRRFAHSFLAKRVAALAVVCVLVGLVSVRPDGSPEPDDAVEVLADPDDTAPVDPAATRTTTSTTTAPTTTSPTTAPPPPGRTGVFASAPGQSEVLGTGELVTYSVEVEEAVGIDPAEVGGIVQRALSDPRSWTADGSTSFQRVEADGQVRIALATPPTADERCAPLRTNGIFSCRVGSRVTINSDRWRNGTDDWPLGIEAYRNHVLNHEMGHALGHGHVFCGGPGQLAPVMMQQTKGLEGCLANPWPSPDEPPPAGG